MNFLQKKVRKWLGFSYLVDAANWQERWRRPNDFITANSLPEEINQSDLTVLLSDSRKLYCNLGPVRGAINDKAVYAVGRAWNAKFTGADREWAKMAEYWVNEIWYPTANARGGNFDFKTDLGVASISTDRDGEIYYLLTESQNGWPQYQMIPAHMIGDRDVDSDGKVKEGPYSGLFMKQGVIYNDSGFAVAYRVLGVDEDDYTDYSARDMVQLFDPEWADQVRGLPAYYHAILDLKDLRTTQGYEKIGAMLASSVGLIEKNEMGAPDPNDPMNLLSRQRPAVNGNTRSGDEVVTQTLAGGSVRYYRSGTGSGIEQLKSERPGASWESFMDRLLRNACSGAGWPYELTWDSSKLGGANVRLLVARAMRTVEDRQDLLRPLARRLVGYAVAKAIKQRYLPPNDEWYKWTFSMPARMSVDYGRDANSDRLDYEMGITNLGDILSEEGKDLDTHIAERKVENEKLRVAGLPVPGVAGKPNPVS